MNRRDVLTSLGLAALGASHGHTAEPDRGPMQFRLEGVPTTTVEELASALRKEGFQWKHIGRQIGFTATVLTSGAAPRVRIEGMDKGHFDTAVIHNALADIALKAGGKVRFRGLIVDQWYGVWQVWRHEMRLAND